MPLGDKTGPMGQGQMTGRRMGFCTGYNSPGYMNQHCMRGFGRGFKRNAFQNYNVQPRPVQQYTEPTKEELLKDLKAENDEIDKAIKELEKKK